MKDLTPSHKSTILDLAVKSLHPSRHTVEELIRLYGRIVSTLTRPDAIVIGKPGEELEEARRRIRILGCAVEFMTQKPDARQDLIQIYERFAETLTRPE